jgi:peptide/nickel transport system permease protein
MLAFIIRRLLQSVVVMLTVSLIAFTLFRFVGDPINQMVGIETTAEERAQLREQLGLNDSVPVQFSRFVANAARLNFGNSYQFKTPVIDLIKDRFPATMELAFASALFALLVGIPMGVYTAINRYSILSNVFLSISLIGISLPTFLIGILLIFLFPVTLGVLPSFGRGEVVRLGFWSTGFLTASGLKALVLPAITLGLFQMTLIMRLVRGEMMEVLRADYIKFARARGLSEPRVQFRPRAEEHAGAGDDHHRTAARLDHRFRADHRERVPVARHGLLFLKGGAERRYPDHVGLSAAGRLHLRDHQPDRRHAVRRGRSAHPHRREGGVMSAEHQRPSRCSEKPSWLRAHARQRHRVFVPALERHDRGRHRDDHHRARRAARARCWRRRTLRSAPAQHHRLAHPAGVAEGRRHALPARQRRSGAATCSRPSSTDRASRSASA